LFFRNRWGQNTRVTGLPGREKSLTISSPVYAIHECVRQTDRRIPANSKDRAYTYRSAVKKGHNVRRQNVGSVSSTWSNNWRP